MHRYGNERTDLVLTGKALLGYNSEPLEIYEYDILDEDNEWNVIHRCEYTIKYTGCPMSQRMSKEELIEVLESYANKEDEG